MIRLDRQKIKQIVNYLLVGATSAVVELLLFQLLYGYFTLGVVISNVSAVLLATALNFVLNGVVTFKSSSNIYRSIVLYVILFLCNMGFTTFAIGFLVNMGIASPLAKISTQICVVIWNFFLYKKVVFK